MKTTYQALTTPFDSSCPSQWGFPTTSHFYEEVGWHDIEWNITGCNFCFVLYIFGANFSQGHLRSQSQDVWIYHTYSNSNNHKCMRAGNTAQTGTLIIIQEKILHVLKEYTLFYKPPTLFGRRTPSKVRHWGNYRWCEKSTYNFSENCPGWQMHAGSCKWYHNQKQ